MVVRQSRHVRGKTKSFPGPTCAQNLTSRMHMKYKQKKDQNESKLTLSFADSGRLAHYHYDNNEKKNNDWQHLKHCSLISEVLLK